MTICFGTGAENFVTSGALFVVTSLVSSGSQKKVYSEDSDFGSRDVGDVVTFIEEAISSVSSASGFQKNDRSEIDFVCGATGDEMSFVEEAI